MILKSLAASHAYAWNVWCICYFCDSVTISFWCLCSGVSLGLVLTVVTLELRARRSRLRLVCWNPRCWLWGTVPLWCEDRTIAVAEVFVFNARDTDAVMTTHPPCFYSFYFTSVAASLYFNALPRIGEMISSISLSSENPKVLPHKKTVSSCDDNLSWSRIIHKLCYV